MGEDSVLTEYLRAAGWDTFKLSRGWLGARSRMEHRADGARAPWSQCPRSEKRQRRSVGVPLRQDLLDNCQDQDSAPAASGPQSGGVKGGSTPAPQIVLSLFIKKMRKEQKCAATLCTDIKAAFYSVFVEVALGSLLPTGTK